MAVMIKPSGLKSGSTIGIIAPASPPKSERVHRGVLFLKKHGYRVKEFRQIRRKFHYLAGDDKSRAAALMEAFSDKEIDAILCARGGYGSIRLLPYLDFEIIRNNPKILLGYSDITVLLLAIYKKTGIVTFHGPMPAVEFGKKTTEFTSGCFFNALEGILPIGNIGNPPGYSLTRIVKGKAEGRLTGGNLCLITKLIGTGYLPSFKNKIVFIEDTDEEPYRIDGYLAQLFQATDFGQASGYIIGEFTRTKPRYPHLDGWSVEGVIKDYFGSLGKPCIAGYPCGHGKEKITIPIGVRAAIDADNKTMKFKEAGVRI